MDVQPGGGIDRAEMDDTADGVLFVVECETTVALAGEAHNLSSGGYVFLPPKRLDAPQHPSEPVRFLWARKAYEPVPGFDAPEAFFAYEKDIEPREMPDTNGAWATTHFDDLTDVRHGMHVNIVTFQPGGIVPFAETHMMEHGLYVLEGKAVYRMNQEWVEVEAGNYLWLPAFYTQACYAVDLASSGTYCTKV
ncbi:allantoin catabolism protein [Fusarium bulbicola]|nr:allantoin catabolism protein [Fusarium bulbicola]